MAGENLLDRTCFCSMTSLLGVINMELALPVPLDWLANCTLVTMKLMVYRSHGHTRIV